MKKNGKRLLALGLALLMCLTLAATALAEEAPVPPEGEEGAAPLPLVDDGQTPEYRELYIDGKGNDETGDGSREAPFASLSRAAEAANETPEQTVYLLLLSDLTLKETARFVGREIILMAEQGQAVLTRGESFARAVNAEGLRYNPAMIELCSPEETAGCLTLVGVIVDDAGICAGTLSAEPSEEADAAPEAEEVEAPVDFAGEAQAAIVTVGDGCSLILSTGSELRNFGGLSAVRLGENSHLTLEPESAIRDTLEPDNLRAAIDAPESAAVEIFEGAQLLERLPKAEAEPTGLSDLLPGLDGDLEFSSLSFTAPETLNRTELSIVRYEIPYELSFQVSERTRNLLEQLKDSVTGADGVIAVTLDSRMEGDVLLLQTDPKLESEVFALDGEASYDEETHTITARFRLREDWKEHLDTLSEPMRFTCTGYLPVGRFVASTETEDQFLTSTGKVGLTLRVSLPGGEARETYLNSPEKSASTKMLGLELSSLAYDVNGGVAGSGPATEQVSAQKAYPLKTEPAPSHGDIEGISVVFLGWSTERIEKIYAAGEEKPELVQTVSVPVLSSITVYAVYSYDSNGDGIADVDQRLAILSFDANGGENAPEPIIHVVGSAESGELGVEIPEQEPNRDYYTFLGWGETPDATKNDKLYKHDAEKAGRRDIPVTKDTTLYAVWERNYQIQYDANGGSNAPAPTVLLSQTKTGTDKNGNPVYTGNAFITSQIPSRSGYDFKGWATSRRGTAAYFAGDEVEISGGNVTLYAVWARNGSGSTVNPGGGSTAPKTGDADMGLYAVLLGVSVLGLAGVGFCFFRKKRKK